MARRFFVRPLPPSGAATLSRSLGHHLGRLVRTRAGAAVVLFDGEDYGEEGTPRDYILGSTYFAEHLKGYRPSAVVIIDMIGERDVAVTRPPLGLGRHPLTVERVIQRASGLGARVTGPPHATEAIRRP